MKICDVVLDTIWYDPRVRKQLIQYEKKGYEIIAVGLMDRRYDAEKISQLPGKVDIIDYQRGSLQSVPVLNKLIKKIQIFKNVREAIIHTKADLVHANDLTALIPAYYAAKKIGAVLIYDAHEINAENYSKKRKVLYAFIMRSIEKHLTRKVDLMVSVSHAAADYFAKTYRIPTPLVVTNCAMKENMQCEFQEKSPSFEVLNHGQYYGGRGYDIMVRACPLLADYPDIVLAIRGFGEMEEMLREEASKLEHPEQFLFYDPVDTKDLISYASRSAVGVAITEPVSLNFQLSISNKIFEYAAAGLPVIMSDIPEHRYLNEKYQFGIVLQRNTPECFTQAAIKLYMDKELYEKCRENALAMSRNLNWENEFDKLINAEEKLIKEKKKND